MPKITEEEVNAKIEDRLIRTVQQTLTLRELLELLGHGSVYTVHEVILGGAAAENISPEEEVYLKVSYERPLDEINPKVRSMISAMQAEIKDKEKEIKRLEALTKPQSEIPDTPPKRKGYVVRKDINNINGWMEELGVDREAFWEFVHGGHFSPVENQTLATAQAKARGVGNRSKMFKMETDPRQQEATN